MRAYFLTLAFTFVISACNTKDLLKIGSRFRGKVDSTHLVLRNHGSIELGHYTTQTGIVYIFCKDKEELVNYIYCGDAGFSTDGVKPGDSYNAVKYLHANVTAKIETGWAFYVDLPSGWRAAFGTPRYYSDEAEIKDTDTIRWFFRR